MTANDVKAQLRAALKRNDNRGIYVEGIGENSAGECCYFRSVIQDVKRYSELGALATDAKAAFCRVVVNFIEVSFDVYCNDPAEQGALFFMHLNNPVSENRRLYRNGKGTPKQIPHDIEDIKRHLLDGWQIGIGDSVEKDLNTRYQHIYVKDTDTISGQRQPVERRARIEITLAGNSLPSRELADWQRFPFEQLTPFFTRRRERADVTDADKLKEIERRMQIDDDPTQRRSHTHEADPINRSVYNALRELSRRWRATAKRGRPATTKHDHSGQLLRGNYLVSDCIVSESVRDSNNYIKGGNSFPSKTQNNQQRQTKTERTSDLSLAESAKPIQHDDQSHRAVDELNELFNESPEAKREKEKIDTIMTSRIGEADSV